MAAERWCRAMALMFLAAACVPMAQAATVPQHAHKTVQLRLLEFLGRSDPTHDARTSDSGRWMVYLSRLNLGKTAPGAGKSAPGASRKKHVRPKKKVGG